MTTNTPHHSNAQAPQGPSDGVLLGELRRLTGWGRTSPARSDVLTPRSTEEIAAVVEKVADAVSG
ncbi:hypothetical protein J0A66_22980, partial [Bowmanella dokdonensis]